MTDRARERPLSPRREALLRAAAELFAARGFRAMSIDEIGAAAGISGPGVYRHFTTKADILLRLCHDAMDHLLTGAQRTTDDDLDAHDRVLALIDLHVAFAVRDQALLAVYLREQLELPARDLRALRARQRDYERVWVDAITRVAGLATPLARATVKLVLSMLNGTAHLKDAVPRAQLVGLLRRLAAGALGEAGVVLERPEPAPPTLAVGR